jgi:PAS domain S-box-containing protein
MTLTTEELDLAPAPRDHAAVGRANDAPPDGPRRLEQLYEISKLFAAFAFESTLDTALKVVAEQLPLESAILLEASIGGHTEMTVWPCLDSVPARLQAARTHAISSYAYLVGARPDTVVVRREGFGPTALAAPDRSAGPVAPQRRYIAIPLVVGRGPVFGALQFEAAARLGRRDLEFVNAVANQLAIALDRHRSRRHDVVRRREAQRLQAKYETLVDHLDYAFVWEADAETRRITYISAQIERMLGFTREQCLAHDDWWSAQVPDGDRQQLERAFASALAEPGNKRVEHRCRAENGTMRWLRTSLHLVGAAGEPVQFQGVSFDITAARAAQDQIREQLSFTSAMASGLAEGTLAVDLDDRITFMNDAAVGLLGCRDRDMLGTPSAALVHLETAGGAQIESPLAAAVRTGRVRNDAHVIVRNDGLRFPASYTATPILRDGRITGAVLAFDDISERKLAQEAEQFLSSAGLVLSASLESAAVASTAARCGVPLLGDLCFVDVVSADDQLRHAAWAHADPEIQTALDGVLGREPRTALFAAPIAEVIATGRAVRAPIVPDAWFSQADLALVRRLEIRSALIVPLAVGVHYLGALTFCMTGDRKHRVGDAALAEKLGRRSAQAIEHARLYEQVRHAVALRDQTLAIVSNDLRSPLATIVVASSLLADDDLAEVSPKARGAMIDKVRVAAEQMDHMIGDLLDFANIEAGKFSIMTRPHDVAGIIEDTIARFAGEAVQRGIALISEGGADMPAVLCDRERMLQVLANLVGNALKTAASGDAVGVAVAVAPDARDAVFSVSDTGPGISLADQQRLFGRHWRSAPLNYKGTGLGLTRGIVEAHRGRLWLDSEPGHGATFSFTVPLAEIAPGGVRSAERPELED